MPKTKPESKEQLHLKEFNDRWEHVVDPARVQAILLSVNVQRPERYNQLMVANDMNGVAYYAVYASGGRKDAEGAPKSDPNTPFDRVYDRGSIPDEF